MAKIQVDYNSVKKQFPKEVAEVEGKIRKGRGKHNEDEFNSFDWHYSWATRNSLQSMLNGAHNKQQRRAMSVDDKVKDVLSRSAITILATKGRGYSHSDVLNFCPIEVKEHCRKLYQNQEDERNKFENLPQAERQKEMKDILKKLSGYGGFRVLGVKK